MTLCSSIIIMGSLKLMTFTNHQSKWSPAVPDGHGGQSLRHDIVMVTQIIITQIPTCVTIITQIIAAQDTF